MADQREQLREQPSFLKENDRAGAEKARPAPSAQKAEPAAGELKRVKSGLNILPTSQLVNMMKEPGVQSQANRPIRQTIISLLTEREGADFVQQLVQAPDNHAQKADLEGAGKADKGKEAKSEGNAGDASQQLPYREELEAQFGTDLGHVKVKTGSSSAEAIGAEAYAQGDEIVCKDSAPDKKVLAHEVAHVLQEERGPSVDGQLAAPSAPAEKEAHEVAEGHKGADAIKQTRRPGQVNRFFRRLVQFIGGLFGRNNRDNEQTQQPPSGNTPGHTTPEQNTEPTVEEEIVPQETAKDRVLGQGPVAKPEDCTFALPPGRTHKLTAADMSAADVWKTLADKYGMSPEHMRVFNMNEAGNAPKDLATDVDLYVPSTDEIVFSQIYTKTRDYELAQQTYGQMKQSGNMDIIAAARERSSGKRGESYGVMGIDGTSDRIGYFLTPNGSLAGARESRTEMVDGQKNYKVIWVNNWKCNIFMNDAVFQAGYKPAQNADKYASAGQGHTQGAYTEVKVKDAGPAHVFQRFGGTMSNQSHTAILSSFVDIVELDDETEKWTYSILGAESDRARESVRDHVMKKGTNETTGGLVVRFMKPKNKR